MDQGEVLRWLRHQEEGVRGLKAEQVVRLDDPGRSHSFEAQGILAFEKPDRYRIRLYAALGITLMDLVVSPRGFRFRMPPRGIDLSGRRDELEEKLPTFPGDALQEAFSHSFEADRTEWHVLEEAYLLILDRQGEGRTIRAWIDRETLTLTREIHSRGGQEELSISYGDYRPVQGEIGPELPHEIDLILPAQGIRLQIRVIRYELNPSFREELFDPFS
jgi:hypothetical protein